MGIGSLPQSFFETKSKERSSEQLETVTFAPLLREYRDRRRLSQSRLAEAAGFDHSYVSRLESGTRMPTRDAVSNLSEAMGLDDGERDALLASAGFMPGRIENLFASEPVLSEVLGLLQDRTVPADVRDDVRHMISLLVRQAHRAALPQSPRNRYLDATAAAD
jgi:transcriptional regulator with XRE-family HTH domain